MATLAATIDFETYSEAGYVWDGAAQRWAGPPGAPSNKRGLEVTGMAVYARHPSTEVLCLAYRLPGRPVHLWLPGLPPPIHLWHWIAGGGLVEAHNAGFEAHIWAHVCHDRMGWPALPAAQMRCSAAKARAHALPGSLGKLAAVLGTAAKDADGSRLIRLLCVPRNPTKANPARRLTPDTAPGEFAALYRYCVADVEAEEAASAVVPDLSPRELRYWQLDQQINQRGVAVDQAGRDACAAIVGQALERYNAQLRQITGGAVEAASQVQRLIGWLAGRGVHAASLDEDSVAELLRQPMPPDAYRALEIRQLVGSAAVKKTYALQHHDAGDGRVRELFVYHAARTGRAAGSGPQPQNLPGGGPDVYRCACGKHYGLHLSACPWCFGTSRKRAEWGPEAADDALTVIAARSLDAVELVWGSALGVVAGCLRGLFVAAPGHDLIGSDYSAIEAVVLAAIAGEQWRLDTFQRGDCIYLAGASKITGVPVADYIAHKAQHGQAHPDRKKIGKVSELASGYGGWVGAWKAFGADEYFNDDEIKRLVLAWRDASPAVVHLWGGQPRYGRPGFGLEGAAIEAVQNPGRSVVVTRRDGTSTGVSYYSTGAALYCTLPSGRQLVYHKPRLRPSMRREGELSLTFWGWNTNAKYGPPGWVELETYGGKLTENVVQAVARDILMHAIDGLNHAGYAVVLHVHDEIVVEVPQHSGSVEQVEAIMADLPAWAKGWPLSAAGGWRGRRYRKG